MRRKDRQITDTQDVLSILDRARIIHLGLFDGGYPYIVPLHYGYQYSKEENEIIFYMHGAQEGKKLDLIRQNPNVCVEIDCAESIISGGEIACKYGASYASVIGWGTAEIVEDAAVKASALSILMEHQTGQPFEISEKMAGSVSVIRVEVSDFTAKSRPPLKGSEQ